MTGMLDGFEDITATAPPKGPGAAPRVSIAWRIQKRGRPFAELLISSTLMTTLGWAAGETRVRIFASTDRTRLALRAEATPGAKLLRKNNGMGAGLTHHLSWVDGPKQPSTAALNEVRDGALILTLPAWARPPEDAAPPQAPAPAPMRNIAAQATGTAHAVMVPATPPAPPAAAPPTERAPTLQWTDARDALLCELWPQIEVTAAEVLRRVAALPGAPLPMNNTGAVYMRAKRIGLPGSRIAAAEAANPGEPAPRPPGNGMDKLTPQREALFRELWPDPTLSAAEIMRRLNALPGEAYSLHAGDRLAERLGLPVLRRRLAGPPPAAAPQHAARIDTDAEDEREAENLIRANPQHWGAKAIAEEYGWPLERAQAFTARVRVKLAAEARAARHGSPLAGLAQRA